LSLYPEWRAWSAHPGPEEKALLEIAKPQIGELDSVEHILFNKQVLPEKKIYTIAVAKCDKFYIVSLVIL
jgi:hypothetical protein